MVFFCHGTGSTCNNSHQNSRRHLYKNKNHGVRKIRARTRRQNVVTSPTSRCTCAQNLSTNPSQQQSSSGDPEKLQEETETDELKSEEKDERGLEEVPFEVIEAEDILLWGCPPHKMPRVNPQEKPQSNFRPSVPVEKAASSAPVYCKRCHQTEDSWSEKLVFDNWDDCFNGESKKTSDHNFNARIPREFSWNTFNPFDDLESFNDFEGFPFPQLFKSSSSSCQIYDVSVDDDKAVVLKQPEKLSQNSSTSAVPIVYEYTSEDEECSTTKQNLDVGSLIITEMKPCGENATNQNIGVEKSDPQRLREEMQEKVCNISSRRDSLAETKVLFEGFRPEESCTDSHNVPDKHKHKQRYCSNHAGVFGIRIHHSLPGMYTVYNVETSSAGSHPGKNRKHRRRKAMSIAITDQCHSLDEDYAEDIDQGTSDDKKTFIGSETESAEAGPSYNKDGPENPEKCSSRTFNPETLELFKGFHLLSSSSKILPIIESAHTIHLRSRSSPSIPSSGTLLSFSPPESFVSSAQTSPVKLNIEEEAVARSQDESILQSYYPESSDSIDGENFYKFYPPPTPLNRSSILRCKTMDPNVFDENLDGSTSNPVRNSLRTRDQTESNSCFICNNVILHFEKTAAQKSQIQKSVLKKSQDKKVSSVKFKFDASRNEHEPQISSPEGVNIKFLRHGIPSISSTGNNSLKKFAIPQTSGNKSSTESIENRINDQCNNNIGLSKTSEQSQNKKTSPKESLQKAWKVSPTPSPANTATKKTLKVRPDSALVKEAMNDMTAGKESTEILIISPPEPTLSSSETKTSKSSRPSLHVKLNKVEPKVWKKKADIFVPESEKIPKKIGKVKERKLTPPHRKARSRGKKIPHRKTNSTSSCSSESEESENCRRKSGTKNRKYHRRYYRNMSESPTDRSLSRESKTYQQRRRRRKKRRKQNLWQKMIQYFFGCECHSKAKTSYTTLRETDSSTNGYYGGDYKPKISFFERIVIWWRRKTHREIVVRQDSVQLFRIKRRQWMREIHEFYEDLRTVNKNVRGAGRKRLNKSRYSHHPVAKMVNSEGCILLRNQGVHIDTINGNKPKEKQKEAKPAKGILKNNTTRVTHK